VQTALSVRGAVYALVSLMANESNRLALRTAIAEYFANGKLPYVGAVYAARPEVVPEAAYEENRFGEITPSENGSGTVLVVNVPSDKRQRAADTGRGAVQDRHVYQIGLEVWFANVSGNGVSAQEDYDVVVSAITNLIRANATMNAPNAIWSAGEYEVGIEHEQREPTTNEDGTTVFVFGAVRFEAWQWIAGNV
jgi:hypothetical protein